MTSALPDAGALPAPGVARRLACFLYEGVLLFGVVMLAGLAYSVATDQRHALLGAFGLRVFLFFVIGLYFIGFWCRQGQTLAMRTWHIRLVDQRGMAPGIGRSIARYLLAWLWFLPALVALSLIDLKGTGSSALAFAVIGAGVLTYALLSRLHPQRQFVHDALCGTRLVTWRPPPKKKA